METIQSRQLQIVAVALPGEFLARLSGCRGIQWNDCQDDHSEAVVPLANTAGDFILLATSQFLMSATALFWAGVRERPRPVTVVAVAEEDNPPADTELLYLGCAGVLKAGAATAEIERALYAVSAGELWFPRMSLSDAIRALLPAPAERRLTPRERQILKMIGQGRNNREIAQALFISRETVRWHVRSLNSKFGVHDRRQVASLALGNPAASRA